MKKAMACVLLTLCAMSVMAQTKEQYTEQLTKWVAATYAPGSPMAAQIESALAQVAALGGATEEQSKQQAMQYMKERGSARLAELYYDMFVNEGLSYDDLSAAVEKLTQPEYMTLNTKVAQAMNDMQTEFTVWCQGAAQKAITGDAIEDIKINDGIPETYIAAVNEYYRASNTDNALKAMLQATENSIIAECNGNATKEAAMRKFMKTYSEACLRNMPRAGVNYMYGKVTVEEFATLAKTDKDPKVIVMRKAAEGAVKKLDLMKLGTQLVGDFQQWKAQK